MIADEPQQRRLLRDDDHRDQQQKEDIIGGVATAVQPSDDQVSPTPSPSVEVDETEEAASASCPAAAVVEQNGGTNCNPTSTPSAAAAAHSNGASRHRVKVYLRTNVEKDWNENGTGNLILGVEEKETKMGPSQGELKSLHVISEIDGRKILQTQIENICNQEKQEETIIMWSEDDRECALSFQEKSDCDEVFNYIQSVKKFDVSSDGLQASESMFYLPDCTFENLELLADALEQAINCPENYERIIEEGDYLNSTLKIITFCINSQSQECLSAMKHLSRICIAYLCFNKQHILDVLLSRDNIFTTIEALQYDSSNGEKQFDHKYFLKNKSSLKHMIDATKDDIMKEKIEITFLMQYIADNFFPINNSVDKSRISAVYSAITLNNLFIVDRILQQKNDIKSLIQKMENLTDLDDAESKQYSLNILLFFKELCSCVQALDRKESFMIVLTELGFLDSLFILIKREFYDWNIVFSQNKSDLSEDSKSALKASSQAINSIIEILSMFIVSCTGEFHKFAVKNRLEMDESGEKDIIDYLIDILHGSLFETCQTDSKIVKILPVSYERLPDVTSSIKLFSDLLGISNIMDTDTIPSHIQFFRNDFYNYYALKIFSPLLYNESMSEDGETSIQFTKWHGYLQSRLIQFLLLLLSQPQDFNTCYNFLKKTNFLEKIDHLCKSSFEPMYIDVILVLMRLIFSNDTFIQLHVMRLSVFSKIFTEIFPRFQHTHNMITGTISHLLDRARLEDSITLRQFIVEKFDHIFENFELTQSFKELKELTLHHLELSRNMKSFGSDILSDNSSSNSNIACKMAKTDDEWLEDVEADEINDFASADSNAENLGLTDYGARDKLLLDKEYDRIFSDLESRKKIVSKNPQMMPGYYSPRPNANNYHNKKSLSIHLTTTDSKSADQCDDGLDLTSPGPANKEGEANGHNADEGLENEQTKSDGNEYSIDKSSNGLVNYPSSDDEEAGTIEKQSSNSNMDSLVKVKLTFDENED